MMKTGKSESGDSVLFGTLPMYSFVTEFQQPLADCLLTYQAFVQTGI